jgi:hypothetical protein
MVGPNMGGSRWPGPSGVEVELSHLPMDMPFLPWPLGVWIYTGMAIESLFFLPFSSLGLGFAILDILEVVYWILSSISRNTVNPLRGVPEMEELMECNLLVGVLNGRPQGI